MSQSAPLFWGSMQFIGLLSGIGWLALIVWLRRRAQRKRWSPLAANDLLAGGILFLFTVGFFWRTLRGDVYQPADGGDLVSFLYPTYRFAAEQLRQWTLPLWNPHLYGGAPFISDIQAGFLYPPNLLLFLLWPDFPYKVMQWLTIGHLYWAGLGMYVLLRTWQWQPGRPLSRPAALFGALAFQFCDPLLIHLGNLNLIAVLSWLPWCLAAYHQALTRHSYRWTALAALLFVISTYAGHAQSTFYVAIAVALYTVGTWVLETREGRVAENSMLPLQRASPLSIFSYPLLLFTLAALLTAPIVLPALALTSFTERSAFTYQDTVAFSLAPTQAIGLITPSFFGRGPALHWSLWARVETPYAGVATVVLAIGAFLLADQAVRRRLLPWAGLALFGFVTALGIYAIVHGWLTVLLPLFGQFRAPARALVLWTLGVAVLGAVGVDLTAVTLRYLAWPPDSPPPAGWRQLQTMLSRGALILLGVVVPLAYVVLLLTQERETTFLRASVAALALMLVLFVWLGLWAILAMYRDGWFSARGLGIALVGLLFFDLAATGAYTDISPSDPTSGFTHPALVAFLRSEAEPLRIDSLTDIQHLWQPDSAALYGLQDVGGIANPLMLDHWRTLWSALGGRHTALYDMLNVKYVLVRDGTPLPTGKFEVALDAPGPLALYRNTSAMPRAWLVHQAETVPNNAQALTAIQAATFDPRQQAVLSTIEPPPSLAPATGPETVQITHYGSNELTLQVEASAPALLVLSEIWYPGWRATVNGVPVPLFQANSALRAVPVPGGTTTVELRFAPLSWRLGLAFFGLGCVLLIVVWIGQRVSKRLRQVVAQRKK
ncbi:MAG: YfhO family protein [Caldilineaceae bacterium]